MENLEGKPDGEHRRSRTGPRLLGVQLLTIALLVAYAVWSKSGSDSWAAAILLSLSVWLDYFILRTQAPESPFANQLSRCEFPKIIFLAFYLYGGRLCLFLGCSKWVPILGLVGGFAGLFVAAYVTWYMLTIASDMLKRSNTAPASSTHKEDQLISELLGNKMLAVTGVLVAFLHVTYAMTFALALSDRAGKSDLFAHRYVDEKPTDPPIDAGDSRLCETTNKFDVRKLFFVESAATLTCTEALRAASIKLNRKSDICDMPDLDMRIQALDNIAILQCDGDPLISTATKAQINARAAARNSLRRAAAWNVRQLYELRSVFRHLACSGEGRSYQIEIRGHANDTKFKTDPAAYGSDHEISKQRADQVERILGEIFRDATADVEAPAVRWLSYGVSNEEEFLEANAGIWPLSLEKKLSVEIRILTIADSFQDRRLRSANPGRRALNLTDYLYFTVYTITTTGYGDIIPISSYAQFVVTIANLMELLFIVLMVNIVANARLPQEDGSKKPVKGDLGENKS
jgi:hypothetical protein